MSPPIDAARDWIANQIRTRVVGRDPAGAAAAIIDAPGPRWFAEGSAIRLVHNDSAMLIGGLGAILMQSLHPLAMAGVAEHSEYKREPIFRLMRTAQYVSTVTFGTMLPVVAGPANNISSRFGWR